MWDAVIDKIQIDNFKSLSATSDNAMLFAQNEFLINMAEHWITRSQQLDANVIELTNALKRIAAERPLSGPLNLSDLDMQKIAHDALSKTK